MPGCEGRSPVASAANVRNHAPVSGHHNSGIIETHVRKQAPNVRKQARLRTSQLFVSGSEVLAARASRPPALVLCVHPHSCLRFHNSRSAATPAARAPMHSRRIQPVLVSPCAGADVHGVAVSMEPFDSLPYASIDT